ncbi:hypothetical protein [Geodermatophilus maliterrae]|uniref:Acetyltransferase (GNAT) domain-containing protein n=1 Tax=Geodermatophilus maliterrae TaxID=3162531 RepID=A0ABV3XLD9_9ACTN
MSRQTLIPLDDRAGWERALDGLPHAFGHTWASCRAMHLTTGWPTSLYVWEDGSSRFACAIAERGGPGTVDVVTPYGFGGFVGTGPEGGLLPQWQEFARARGYVCGYLGLNPLFVPPVCRASGDYGEHNDVHVLALDSGPDRLFARLSGNRRRQVRAFETAPARLSADRERLAEYFLAGIDDFLRSRGAGYASLLGGRTWRALLERDEVFVLGVEEDGSLVAASVFAHTPYCGEYLFGISSPAGRAYSAVLVWAAALRLAESGVPRLNLGGGVRRGDGIAAFKERFGGERLPLGALRQVYRPAAYARLCAAAGRDPGDRTGFFPPYRAPRDGRQATGGAS